jgi:hypothetical protein
MNKIPGFKKYLIQDDIYSLIGIKFDNILIMKPNIL